MTGHRNFFCLFFVFFICFFICFSFMFFLFFFEFFMFFVFFVIFVCFFVGLDFVVWCGIGEIGRIGENVGFMLRKETTFNLRIGDSIRLHL